MDKILTITKEKLYLDTFNLDTEINAYIHAEEQLVFSFNKKRKDAKNNLENTCENIVSNIKNTLITQSSSISEALLAGNQVAAEAIIIETIRPIMLSLMKDISYRQIDTVTEALDFAGLVNEKDREALIDVAMNVANNIKGLIDQGTFSVKNINEIEKEDKKMTTYRVVTGAVAIGTDIVVPWLEVVIILLPDIVKLFHGMFGESDLELSKRRFVNNVIPQIINKLYPQVKQNAETTTKQVIDEYERLLNEKLEAIKNNIINTKLKKKEKTEEYEKYKEIILEDISIINKLIQRLGE